MSFNLDRSLNHGLNAAENYHDFQKGSDEVLLYMFFIKPVSYQNIELYKTFEKFQSSRNNNQNEVDFYLACVPPLPKQYFACLEPTFLSDEPDAILAYLNNAFHVNSKVQLAASQFAFRRAEQPFNTPTFDDSCLISGNSIP
jgi:hypothetical protein